MQWHEQCIARIRNEVRVRNFEAAEAACDGSDSIEGGAK